MLITALHYKSHFISCFILLPTKSTVPLSNLLHHVRSNCGRTRLTEVKDNSMHTLALNMCPTPRSDCGQSRLTEVKDNGMHTVKYQQR